MKFIVIEQRISWHGFEIEAQSPEDATKIWGDLPVSCKPNVSFGDPGIGNVYFRAGTVPADEAHTFVETERMKEIGRAR